MIRGSAGVREFPLQSDYSSVRAARRIAAIGALAAVLLPGSSCITHSRAVPSNEEEPVSTGSPLPADEGSAAENFEWGSPLVNASDEFNYEGSPDPLKWRLPPAGCWEGHAGNGRRCAENTTVNGTVAVMVRESNGDTGWMRSNHHTRYGRWEVRSRSKNNGGSGGLYHVLHLIWPTGERWPDEGEYDWVEYVDPDAQCLEAFIHYPHPNLPVQQEHAEICPVDMNDWNNFAFEWTPDHVKGFVNGVEWFHFADGGGPNGRSDIQDMPSGAYTMQLDNFTGDGGLRPAVYEMDWYRFYPLSERPLSP
jgi:beta-glucanase (GH16 family)